MIINGDPEHFDESVRIARVEIPRYVQGKYNRPGWGWNFQRGDYPGATFWVRGLKDGIAITAKPWLQPPSASTGEKS